MVWWQVHPAKKQMRSHTRDMSYSPENDSADDDSFRANLLPSETIENEIQVKRLYKGRILAWSDWPLVSSFTLWSTNGVTSFPTILDSLLEYNMDNINELIALYFKWIFTVNKNNSFSVTWLPWELAELHSLCPLQMQLPLW